DYWQDFLIIPNIKPNRQPHPDLPQSPPIQEKFPLCHFHFSKTHKEYRFASIGQSGGGTITHPTTDPLFSIKHCQKEQPPESSDSLYPANNPSAHGALPPDSFLHWE